MPEKIPPLRRVVSYHDQSVFASPPSVFGHTELDHDEGFTTKKLAIVMVGLPARGKSHIAGSIERYLNWLGHTARVYNAGTYRRRLMQGQQDADFFDPGNKNGVRLRSEIAMACLDDMIAWLVKGDGVCGIYDATNSTVDRRKHVVEKLNRHQIRCLFVESICTDERIVERNITETKLHSPDYVGVDPETATTDFKSRIQKYDAASETLTEAEGYSYIKVINVGKQIILNAICGYMQGKIVQFLLNTHITGRSIYLMRSGESHFNVEGRIGGDGQLTQEGQEFTQNLRELLKREFTDIGRDHPAVWTSQLTRARETVSKLPCMSVAWRAMNEIDAGVCEGLTYDEIGVQLPEVSAERAKDKLRYRYPGGESYIDVISRLEPVILELERQRGPVVIVAHNAVIRCMLAYFTGKSRKECPFLDVPLHTVIKLTTRAYGVEENRFVLGR